MYTASMIAICICSAAMAGILSIVAMVANGVLLYVMYKDPLRCFRKPISVVIAALAMQDFLTGSVVGTLHIRNEISCETIPERTPVTGSFKNIIGLFSINNGTLLVMCLSIERLIAVALPFYYRATASSRKTQLCAVCIVVYSLIFCLLQLSGIPEGVYSALQLHLNMTFPLIAVLIFNFALLRVLRGYRKRVSSMSSDASDSSFSAAAEKRIDIDKQFALTAFLIVLFLVLSHSPYYLMTLIEVHCSHCNGEWVVSCRRISLPFLFINAACNPFTYTFRIPECRRSLKVLFFRRQDAVEVFPKSPNTPDWLQTPIVLRKLSIFSPANGQFIETFTDENLPHDFSMGIDNPQDILDIDCEIWDTKL